MWRRISVHASRRVRRHTFSPCAAAAATGNPCHLFSTKIRINDPPTKEEIIEATEEQQLHFQKMKLRLTNKKKAPWVDPWDVEDTLDSKIEFDELPEWNPEHVSRVSQERIKVRPLMTLQEITELSLPPLPPPNPGKGQTKAYALYRKRTQFKHVKEYVIRMAEPRVAAIQALSDWDTKQDAVDELFEEIEFELKRKMPVLGKHPLFGSWVERALEEYLQSVRKGAPIETPNMAKVHTLEIAEDAEDELDTALDLSDDELLDDDESSSDDSSDDEEEEASNMETAAKSEKEGEEEKRANDNVDGENMNASDDNATILTSDEPAVETPEIASTEESDTDVESPYFMDCFDTDKDTEETVVPSILHPLQPKQKPYDNTGRMIEEWELSAHKESKRIMIRKFIQQIATTLASSEQVRVLVHGDKGIGKTAGLAAIVAAARKSGYIVLYMPDGDRLQNYGFYVEPNHLFPDVFDLPLLSAEVCKDLLKAHKDDLEGFVLPTGLLEQSFPQKLFTKLPEYPEEGMPVTQLLEFAAEREPYAAMAFHMTVELLKNQDQKPFLIVLDEFNCLFERGQYYHGSHDSTGKKPIPHNQISLFKPVLDAMAILDESTDASPVLMKRGGIVVATSESRGVSRKITDTLVEYAKRQSTAEIAPILVQEVPRLSALEIEHMLSHYESTGVGKLRMDRGATVMNKQEVAYLRMLSGGIPQKLMNACIV